MVRQPNELFDKAKIKKYCSDIQITVEQRDAAKEWLDLLDKNKLEKEDQNRPIFEHVVLQKILGYTVYDYVPEKDNADYTISNRESGKSLCIEVKGTSTKDLFAYQHRGKKEQENPIKQTWIYMGQGYDYGLCTNYDDFVLLSRNVGFEKVYKFNFSTLKEIQNKLDEEKLKEFIGIFGKTRIFDEDIVTKLTNESILAEQEFTDEFYKLFHETRLMLIQEFSSLPDVTRDEAIHWAQIYLNRLIFVFFVEDNNFISDKIFHKRIMDVIKSPSISEYTHLISENINGLFKIMNNGSKIHGIYGFNGGLFEKEIPSKIFFADLKDSEFFKDVKQNSKLSKKSLAIDIDITLSNKYADLLNPIIKNLLNMDSYDFTSDLNVNILGHIFEQSISDLEELREEQETSRRKKEGIYYTPEYVTDYICRNTIIPYLSKKNGTTVRELIDEYSDNIQELEKKLKEIKILDPACGSGAFLIKAVEIVLEIDKRIQDSKYQPPGSTQLTAWSQEKEITKIVEECIFGVDINEESVEITKLSLFLKLASPNKKLISLSQNIKVGNSLVDDKSVDPMAFNWKNEFKEIFGEGGFDIIIGNPPYLKIEHLSEDERQYFQQNYQRTYMKRYDAYGLFVDESISLLKDGGLFGMIIPSTMLNNITFTKLRKLILDSTTTLQIVNLGGKIFENVDNDTLILLLKKIPTQAFDTEIYEVPKYGGGLVTAQKIGTIDLRKVTRPPTFSFELRVTQDVSNILAKMEINSIPLGEICNAFQGLTAGNNEAFFVTNKEIDSEKLERAICKPSVFGYEVERYEQTKPGYYVIYLTRNDQLSDFPRIKKRLEPFKSMLEKKREVKLGRQPWYSLHWPRNRTNFERREKLLVQSIRNLALKRRIVATIDYDRLYADHTLNVLILENPAYDLRYVLGILNSNLVNYLFQNKYVDINIKAIYLEAIPIRKLEHDDPNKEIKNKLIEKINFIVERNKEFYSKHEKFLSRISSTFSMEKISTKLKNFYEMTFESFLVEIKKSTKISLKDQDEWEDYFEQYKSELLNLKEQIDTTDRELNQMVYELYGITNDERKIIENSLYSVKSDFSD